MLWFSFRLFIVTGEEGPGITVSGKYYFDLRSIGHLIRFFDIVFLWVQFFPLSSEPRMEFTAPFWDPSLIQSSSIDSLESFFLARGGRKRRRKCSYDSLKWVTNFRRKALLCSGRPLNPQTLMPLKGDPICDVPWLTRNVFAPTERPSLGWDSSPSGFEFW